MKRVLITRAQTQSAAFAQGLRSAGFEPVFLPVIEIRSMQDNTGLEQALQNLGKYEWVVFSSVNGVEVVFNHLPGGEQRGTAWRDSIAPAEWFPHCAAVGPKTAEALRGRGVTPDFVPGEYVAEAILPGLGDLNDKWVLLPQAELARRLLPEAIAAAGGIAHEIAVYRTLPAEPDMEGLEAVRAGVDVITLASPSAVQNLAAMLRKDGLDPLELPGDPTFACIGPITEAAAREEGLQKLLTAADYTTDGLIEIIGKLGDWHGGNDDSL